MYTQRSGTHRNREQPSGLKRNESRETPNETNELLGANQQDAVAGQLEQRDELQVLLLLTPSYDPSTRAQW